MNKHIVIIRVGSRDWDVTLERCEWDELPPTPVSFVPLIRLYKHVKDCSLREAKAAIENSIHRESKYGEYTFLLDDADIGRLYMFLRDGNHVKVREPAHLAGFEVIDIQSTTNGGIIA